MRRSRFHAVTRFWGSHGCRYHISPRTNSEAPESAIRARFVRDSFHPGNRRLHAKGVAKPPVPPLCLRSRSIDGAPMTTWRRRLRGQAPPQAEPDPQATTAQRWLTADRPVPGSPTGARARAAARIAVGARAGSRYLSCERDESGALVCKVRESRCVMSRQRPRGNVPLWRHSSARIGGHGPLGCPRGTMSRGDSAAAGPSPDQD